MAKSVASAVIPAPPERVWEAVRDFNGLPAWHPAVTASELDDGKSGDQVGSVRRLTLGDGGLVVERLMSIDDAAQTVTYDILEAPFAVRRYRASIQVRPVTDTGQSFVEWTAHYDAEAADEEELDKTLAEGVFATGLGGLRSHFGG